MEQQQVLQEIKRVILGKDAVVEKVLTAILAGGHVLLEDVPGVGKTTLALAFSKALGLSYRRIQFTSDTMPSDVLGFSLYDKEKQSFRYQSGPIMTHLLLADEINRTSSKTQAALLEAMEERRVTVDGETHALPVPFVVLATQNPVGSAGTQRLPASQLDRFMVRLSMGYPDFQSQVEILKDRHTENPLDSVSQVIDRDTLLLWQRQAAAVHVADEIYAYITRLAEATRTHEMLELGLSPRGALSVCRFVKAHAFLAGRDYVIPKDVKEVFGDTAAHRLILSRKARIAEVHPEEVVREILQKTELPRVAVEEPGRR